MSSETPERFSKWVLGKGTDFEDLKLEHNVPLPPQGDGEVLVKMHAASLNYRDLVIAKVRDIVHRRTWHVLMMTYRGDMEVQNRQTLYLEVTGVARLSTLASMSPVSRRATKWLPSSISDTLAVLPTPTTHHPVSVVT